MIMEVKIGMIQLKAKKCQGLLETARSWERGRMWILPQSPEENSTTDTLILDPWSPELTAFCFWSPMVTCWGLPGGSDCKESACNAGDPALIPRSERSLGEANGKPLQYSCLENTVDRETWWATVHGITKESDMTEQMSIYGQLLLPP